MGQGATAGDQLDLSDTPIISWQDIRHTRQGPKAARCVVVHDDINIIHLQISCLSVPLVGDRECRQVLTAKPFPEMLRQPL